MVAGALSLLAYTATAVVSATSAIEYIKALYPELSEYFLIAVIALLGFFALLNLLGLTGASMQLTLCTEYIDI
jgi:amino acid transporter